MPWPKKITKYGASIEKAEPYNQAIDQCAYAIEEISEEKVKQEVFEAMKKELIPIGLREPVVNAIAATVRQLYLKKVGRA